MVTENNKAALPFYDCPRYNKCSVNNCPLHPAYPNLPTDEGDSEQKWYPL